MRYRFQPLARAVAIGVAVSVSAITGGVVFAGAGTPIKTQVLTLADFHGALQVPEPDEGGEVTGPDGKKVAVGGAAYLSAHLKKVRAGTENSMLVSNGDMFSGPSFEADVHADEPTVEVMNQLGVEFSSYGNHEFDVSKSFVNEHVEKGECFGHVGKDSCFTDSSGKQFRGSDFPFSTANVVDSETGHGIAPPYYVKQVSGTDGSRQPVGFINITTPGTEVGPSSYQTDMHTLDTVATANKYAAKLKSMGVNAILLNVHDGAKPVDGKEAPYNGCDLASGPLIDVAANASADIDAILGGHLHTPFNCRLPDPAGDDRPVIEPGYYGGLFNELNLEIDPQTGEVLRDSTTATNHANSHNIEPDPQMQDTVEYWKEQGHQRESRPVAEITDDFTVQKTGSGESSMGDLAADVNLWAANRTKRGKADFGLVMTDPEVGDPAVKGDMLVKDSGSPGDADGRITEGEAWQEGYGYGDPFLTVTLTGEQIDAALEQQWSDTKFSPLAVSENVSYSFDSSAAFGNRVEPQNVKIGGEAMDPAKSYRVAVMSYTALGEDGISALADFTQPYRIQPGDHESFVAYLEEKGAISPLPRDRVTKT